VLPQDVCLLFKLGILRVKDACDLGFREYINEWRKQRAKEEEELKRLKEKQAKRKEIRYIQFRTGVTVYTWRRRSSSGSRRSRPSGRRSDTYSTDQGSQCTQGAGGAQAAQREAGQEKVNHVHAVQNRGHSVHWEEEELKRLKEKQAKRKEIRYIQSRTGATVYTGRRRSSSGSRRSRPSGRRSVTCSSEQGPQCTLGGGGAQAAQGEAGQEEGDQVHTVQNRGHRTHRMRRMSLANQGAAHH
jgi:hypothetical protein